jgi:ribonucleoside-diphosphate reductase alpha chain
MSEDKSPSYYVIKRSGIHEEVDFGKISKRLIDLYQLGNFKYITKADITKLSQGVITKVSNGIPTQELDRVAALLAAEKISLHPEYNKFAGMIEVSNHHKNTESTKTMMAVTMQLYHNQNDNGDHIPLVSYDYYKFVKRNAQKLDEFIMSDTGYNKDFDVDFIGFKTFERSYLLKLSNGKIIERIQQLWMRVAIAIYMPRHFNHVVYKQYDDQASLEYIYMVYTMLSKMYGIHATPTLYNAGSTFEQFISCFLMGIDDSLNGIMDLAKDCALISKYSGGIGYWLHPLRASGSYINGTNGKSNGPIPFIQILAETSKAFNQGGKRPGSFAGYLSIDHPQFMDFIQMRKLRRDADLYNLACFIGAWIHDEFMVRVIKDETWYFIDPAKSRNKNGKYLYELIGKDYEEHYNYLVEQKAYSDEISARKLFQLIASTQLESGYPYVLFADACNVKSNQKNLGTINSSNLCTEIIEYSSPDEYACCVLASVCLQQFVKDNKFDLEMLVKYVRLLVRNLNRIIDINKYPVVQTKLSNYRHRPLGIGVQGLADVYNKLDYPFDSPAAKRLNILIFEAIYYGALSESCQLAREQLKAYKAVIREQGKCKVPVNYHTVSVGINYLGNGTYQSFEKQVIPEYKEYDEKNLPNTSGAYPSYAGSPMSEGKYQFDLWKEDAYRFNDMVDRRGLPQEFKRDYVNLISNKWDWHSLSLKIAKFGIRNSLLVAPMPTASTSILTGSNSCFEPYSANLYSKSTLTGTFTVVNASLIEKLCNEKCWDEDMLNRLINAKGSVQSLDVPAHIKEQFKTAYELSQKSIIDQCIDRGHFICQSQSMNIYLRNPTVQKVCGILEYGWMKGIKTAMYYLRAEVNRDLKSYANVISQSTKEFDQDLGDTICEACN